jgi:hypothetical protein
MPELGGMGAKNITGKDNNRLSAAQHNAKRKLSHSTALEGHSDRLEGAEG